MHEAADVGRRENGDKTDLALKGRVAFSGAAIEANDHQKPIVDDGPIETVTMVPRASFAPFYLEGAVKDWSDEQARIAGRKRYLPRFPQAKPDAALAEIRMHLQKQVARLSPEARAKPDNKSKLRLLKEAEGRELRCSSRIRLHNVTAEEIGLVLFALTHGGDSKKPYRHQIGRAKPYGAGQLRVVSARLTLEANGPEGNALLKAPTDEEKPGPGREGFCPGASELTGFVRANASHRPFLEALKEHMHEPANSRGADQHVLAKFPETRAVEQFLVASDPNEGVKMATQVEDGGLYLKIADHRRLKQQTMMLRNGRARAERPKIVLPADPAR